jgi:hypothetical protein
MNFIGSSARLFAESIEAVMSDGFEDGSQWRRSAWAARAQLVSWERGASRAPFLRILDKRPRSGSAWRQSHAGHGIVWARGFYVE